MIALVDEPLVREAFFPSSVQHYAVETARPGRPRRDRGDRRAARAARAGRARGARGGTRSRARSASRATRAAGSSRSRSCASSPTVPQRLLDARPAVRARGAGTCARIRSRAASRSCSPGSRSRTAPAQAPSPCFAALLRDIERASLEAGPGAAAHLLRVARRRAARPARAARLRRRSRTAPRSSSAASAFRPIVCDLGPESVAGWLSALAARDLPVEATALDEDARELVARRPPRRAHQARVRRAALPARARGPAGRARGAPARRVGLRVDRRLQRRRRRRLRAAPQARRPRGRAGDRARRRLPPAAASDADSHSPAITRSSARRRAGSAIRSMPVILSSLVVKR